MTLAVFWLACAGLVALAGLMLWMSTRPRMRSEVESSVGGANEGANLRLLRQQLAGLNADLAAGSIDFEEHRLARAEMECRVIEELPSHSGRPAPGPMPRQTVVLLTLVVAAAASGLYAMLGNTAGLSPPAASATAAPDADSRAVEAMLDDMAKRMSSQPPQSTDAAGWAFLGRSYAAVQRFESASDAYARALAQAPDDTQLLVDRADVLSMLQGRSTDGEPRRLIERALQLDPANLKALALAGSDAFERKDFTAALAFWSKARELAPAGAFAENMGRGIEEARAALGGTPVAAAIAPTDSAPTDSAPRTAAVIAGRVTIAQKLADRVRPGDVLFVFARAENGPRMPLAIARYDAGRLPIDFRLDDSSAMSAALRLSGFPRVVIGARISRTGSATPTAGDLHGHSGVIDVGNRSVVVEIKDSE